MSATLAEVLRTFGLADRSQHALSTSQARAWRAIVLHTWTQDLRRHIHVHALMACGGLDGQGRWCAAKRSPTFMFPVRALSRVLRGKLLDALARAGQAGKLPHDPASTDVARQARLT